MSTYIDKAHEGGCAAMGPVLTLVHDAQLEAARALRASEDTKRITARGLEKFDERMAEVETKLGEVDSKINEVPRLVTKAVSSTVDDFVRRNWRKAIGWIGALMLGSSGGVVVTGWIRFDQSDQANIQRVQTVQESTEALQRRLYAQAVAEGRAQADRELAARSAVVSTDRVHADANSAIVLPDK